MWARDGAEQGSRSKTSEPCSLWPAVGHKDERARSHPQSGEPGAHLHEDMPSSAPFHPRCSQLLLLLLACPGSVAP